MSEGAIRQEIAHLTNFINELAEKVALLDVALDGIEKRVSAIEGKRGCRYEWTVTTPEYYTVTAIPINVTTPLD